MTTESATSSSSNQYSSSVVRDSMEGYTNQSDNLEVDNGTFDNTASEIIEDSTQKCGINWTYVIIAIVLIAVAIYYFRKIKKEKEKLKLENN
jgi:flagellar biosynthesis/type III secretory pathway M-ring protein FliF/YscJ